MHLIPESLFERLLHKETKVLAAFEQPMPERMLLEERVGRRGRG